MKIEKFNENIDNKSVIEDVIADIIHSVLVYDIQYEIEYEDIEKTSKRIVRYLIEKKYNFEVLENIEKFNL